MGLSREKQIQLSGWMLGDLDPVFEFEWEVGWGGAGRFLNVFAFRMGANSRLGAYSNK